MYLKKASSGLGTMFFLRHNKRVIFNHPFFESKYATALKAAI